MKLKKWTGFIVILFTISLISVNSHSQAPVETSKEKVIISGTPYYIHTVKKGQTAYSIARAYGIEVSQLTEENPPALYGIKEGQVLRIPATGTGPKPAVAIPTIIQNKDEIRFTYHKLRPGETIYSLSRLYGVSDAVILQSNPGIDINKLSVGSEIAIPKKDFMTQKEKFSPQEKNYIYHKVEQGETLQSIAQKYGISLRVLRRENRNIRFPRVGDFIRVPAEGLSGIQLEEPEVADTLPVIVEEPPVKFARPIGFTEVKDLEGSMDVAVLLPFYLNKNSDRVNVDSLMVKGKKQYKISKRPDDWIYPQSFDFTEMYDGILMAADTIRSLGLDINLFTYDIQGDTAGITKLIRSGKLDNMDLIIGPVFSNNLRIVSKYAGELGIPVVSPVPLISNAVLAGNPTVFMTNPSLEVAQKTLVREIGKYNTGNLVFIHTDSTAKDPDVGRFRRLIFDELTQKMPYEEIRFRELIFYPRSAFGNDSINRISHTLSEGNDNIVIIASEDPAVVSEIVTIVHGFTKKFNVRVYGYPSMIYLDNLDPKIFFELNQLIFSPYKVDYSAQNVRRFNLNYLKKYLTMPLETSYAWMGYDIGYYFLSGLAIHGKLFVEHPEIHNPELLQNSFEFERKTPEDGFENQKLFRFRYTRDYELKIEE